jgi:hypothetical protein
MRHVTRLALVLILLGITALFPTESVHSSIMEPCPYPECTSFDGVSCPKGAQTLCSYGTDSSCRALNCNCVGGQWICP